MELEAILKFMSIVAVCVTVLVLAIIILVGIYKLKELLYKQTPAKIRAATNTSDGGFSFKKFLGYAAMFIALFYKPN